MIHGQEAHRRAWLPNHVVARHTWHQSLKESDSEYFDRLPIDAQGEFHAPTGMPRHRALQHGDRVRIVPRESGDLEGMATIVDLDASMPGVRFIGTGYVAYVYLDEIVMEGTR